jgi:hypothetical protein
VIVMLKMASEVCNLCGLHSLLYASDCFRMVGF